VTSSGLKVTVRTARSADAEAIAKVYVETWRTTYAGMVPDKVLLDMSEEVQSVRWARAFRHQGELIMVAEDAGMGVVGMASGGRARGKSGLEAEVFTLYVLPDLQGHGVGRGLLTGMFGAFRARGLNSAIIWVLAPNPARFFYESVGGARIAERQERLWGADLPEIAYGWPDLKAALEGRLGA